MTVRRGYPFSLDVDGASLVIVADGFPARTHVPPFSFTAEETATMPEGKVYWETSDADGKFLAGGTLNVVRTAKQDGESAFPKSFAQQALEKVEEVLLTAAADATTTISVGNDNFTFETRRELLAFRARLKWEIRPKRGIAIKRGMRNYGQTTGFRRPLLP